SISNSEFRFCKSPPGFLQKACGCSSLGEARDVVAKQFVRLLGTGPRITLEGFQEERAPRAGSHKYLPFHFFHVTLTSSVKAALGNWPGGWQRETNGNLNRAMLCPLK